MKKNIVRPCRSFAVFILTKLVLVAMIVDAQGLAGSVKGSVEVCLYIIIPSLFGFMLISSLLIRSGLYKIVFKPLYIILRHVIRLSEEEFAIFLLSLFGGYPVGAKLISESKEENVQRLLPFCYCPSPGFVITVVGIGIFSNARAGLAVYLSNVLACVIMAIALTFKNKKRPVGLNLHTNIKSYKPAKLSQVIETITSSVMSASHALFLVCAIVTAFGVLEHVLRFYKVERLFSVFGNAASITEQFFFATLEITAASSLPPSRALLPIIAALFSFGGLCIIMQIPAIMKGGNNPAYLGRFLLLRIPVAILSAVICRLMVMFLNLDLDFAMPVINSTANIILPSQSASPIASAALLIMSVILVKTAGASKADTCKTSDKRQANP